MASNNQEIEIKIPLSKTEFDAVKEKLKAGAQFVGVSCQKDEYFTPAHKDFTNCEYPFEWLSLRQRGNKHILNYKHFYPENAKAKTHCDELETEIKDCELLKKMLSALGFKHLVTVDKTRESYLLNGEFEICLDKISELGHFIEIEAAKDFGSVDNTRKKLFDVAKDFGIDATKTDDRGYPYLIMAKQGLIRYA